MHIYPNNSFLCKISLFLARNRIFRLLADVPTAEAEEEEEAPASKEPSKRVAVEAS